MDIIEFTDDGAKERETDHSEEAAYEEAFQEYESIRRLYEALIKAEYHPSRIDKLKRMLNDLNEENK